MPAPSSLAVLATCALLGVVHAAPLRNHATLHARDSTPGVFLWVMLLGVPASTDYLKNTAPVASSMQRELSDAEIC